MAFALITMVGSQTQDAAQGAVVMALIGVANAVTTTLSFPLFTDLMPRDRIAEFTGFSALVTSLAQAVGAGMVGAFVDLTGNFRTVFIATGFLIAVSFLLLQGCARSRPIFRTVEGIARPATWVRLICNARTYAL